MSDEQDFDLEVIERNEPLAYSPRETEFTRPFWDALRKGRLQTSRCDSCGHLTFPPREFCPKCWSRDISWQICVPKGKLYSWTRIHAGPAAFSKELPFAVGVVDLESGIRIACRLHGEGDWHCDMDLRLVALVAPNGTTFCAARASVASAICD